MRLFVAVDLDARARGAMTAAQAALGAGLEGASAIRWVRAGQMHLTLLFLGAVDDARAAAVVAGLGRPVAQAPFDLALGGLGVFPPRGAPRAVWAGVMSGKRELDALQREIADRVARLGLPLEARPFSPHLTLGRWKRSRASDRRRLLDRAPAGTLTRITVDHATLFESRLAPDGPVYTALARANLTAD